MPTRRFEDLAIFTEDELAWADPAPEGSAAVEPRVPLTEPRSTRTLAGDLRRLRHGLVRGALDLPTWVLLLVVAGLAAGVVALALRETSFVVPDEAERAAAPAQLPSDEQESPAVEKTLRLGNEGETVRGVQAALHIVGFDSQAPDGFFGGSTSAAVAAFQSARGLPADGVVGPLTSGALREALFERARAEATTAGRGLTEAAAAGRLSAKSATRYQSILTDALSRFDRLSPAKSAYLALVLRDAAFHAPDYNEARALSLFTMVEANAKYLARGKLSSPPADFVGADGVVYRFTRSHGFQFHPIANFARLNSLAGQKRRDDVARLSAALLARGVPTGDALIWEYYFPFGGTSPWTSGFAQAVAAQALARSGALLRDPGLYAGAQAAFRAIPRTLAMQIGGGLWVREYGFSDIVILNAQLQTLISLREYVEVTDNGPARAVVSKLETATLSLLPQFDTGCWSLYSLGGSPAALHYHKYHVSLLKQLAEGPGGEAWRGTAARWEGFLAAQSSSARPCAAP